MKDIRFGNNVTRYKELLFKYPCVSPLTNYLEGTNVYVLDETESYSALLEGIKEKGGNIVKVLNPDELSICDDHAVGIIMPPAVSDSDTIEAYYHILEYYIHFAQRFINAMKNCSEGFPHLIFVMPHGADRYSCHLTDMAFYAVTGLIGGLAREYGPYGIVVNGIMAAEQNREASMSHWLKFLASGNANNILGEIIKL